MNTALLPEAIEFYNQGNSMASTARKFSSTPGTLKKLFKAQGVYIRNQSEQVVIENKKRTKKVNHDYFEMLTPESAYYLGFIAADGTIRKDRNEIKIALSSVDRDFLLEMKERMGIETEVKNYETNNGFTCSELRFSSLKIKQDLMGYGICPYKTYIGLSLDLIPEEFQKYFIKGYFDGDGSFSFNKKTKQAKVTFTSHTKEILESIIAFFELDGGIYQDKRTLAYSLEFSTLPSLEIMRRFYELDTPCLKRKKEKYEEYLKLRNKAHETEPPSTKDEKLC